MSPVAVSLDFRGTTSSTQPLAVSTGEGCAWTAGSDVSWLRVSTTSGSGPGTVSFAVDTYTDEPARTAPIMVRWPTVTAGQNVWVTQTGCHFDLASTQGTFAASGGSGRVEVVNQEDICPFGCGCPWTATSPVPWIRIASNLPRFGGDSVSFTVDPNAGPPRSSVLTIAGKPFLVTQGGQ